MFEYRNIDGIDIRHVNFRDIICDDQLFQRMDSFQESTVNPRKSALQ